MSRLQQSQVVRRDRGNSVTSVPEKLCNLPPLNSVATQVVQMSAEPDVDPKALEKIIEKDPAFATDVLYLANSPLFGLTSIIQGLRQAIAVIGSQRIKGLAYTVAMRGFVGRTDLPAMRACWRHSAACAVIAEQLGPMLDVSADRSYTAGLMHDIGRLGLLKTYPTEYDKVIGSQHAEVSDILRAEKVALGMDHCEAGAWLAKAWGLPESFESIAAHHHDELVQTKSDLLYVVQMACMLADSVGFATIVRPGAPGFEELTGQLPEWLRTRFTCSARELRQSFEQRFAGLA